MCDNNDLAQFASPNLKSFQGEGGVTLAAPLYEIETSYLIEPILKPFPNDQIIWGGEGVLQITSPHKMPINDLLMSI